MCELYFISWPWYTWLTIKLLYIFRTECRRSVDGQNTLVETSCCWTRDSKIAGARKEIKRLLFPFWVDLVGCFSGCKNIAKIPTKSENGKNNTPFGWKSTTCERYYNIYSLGGRWRTCCRWNRLSKRMQDMKKTNGRWKRVYGIRYILAKMECVFCFLY